VALAVALALVPLLVVPLLRPLDSPDEAVLLNTILTPVDDRIDVAVSADDGARVVTWSHPPVGSSDVFYRVFRTAPGGETECLEHGGSAECTPELDLLGTTRERRWRDESPRARSAYRIGIAANWRDDPAAGDVATLSRPAGAE
jgi:hypothetical protein